MSKAEATRSYILQKSFDLIYQKGYQSTSIDEIIATTQVTKGAFFYHFKNKEEMGLAVISEIMSPSMSDFSTAYLKEGGDVRTNIYKMMEALLLKNDFFKVEYGCPLVNLIEEMSAHNQAFRKLLRRVVVAWQTEIESALSVAQNEGQIAGEHDPTQIAQYITANYGGVRYLGKVFGKQSYKTFLHEFKKYLDCLH
ncbi:TetR/AcrR family transcriptional regulator [Arcticibacter sp.]|uniref:TetR/AcrR family transcriptional regulator n=1 Tax=Arcticibacter sp. TaxID=1872630 RepID=UPI00388ECE25